MQRGDTEGQEGDGGPDAESSTGITRFTGLFVCLFVCLRYLVCEYIRGLVNPGD